jgi:large subunit ribosomal protein L19e
MKLSMQRRLAAEIMKVGADRVWIDPDQCERVESAITRSEIRKLIHEGVVQALPERGISRGRKKRLHLKRKAGRRRGPGTRRGTRVEEKRAWINKIRVIRETLRKLRDRRYITAQSYRKILAMAKGGTFRSASHLNEYLETHKLLKRR